MLPSGWLSLVEMDCLRFTRRLHGKLLPDTRRETSQVQCSVPLCFKVQFEVLFFIQIVEFTASFPYMFKLVTIVKCLYLIKVNVSSERVQAFSMKKLRIFQVSPIGYMYVHRVLSALRTLPKARSSNEKLESTIIFKMSVQAYGLNN